MPQNLKEKIIEILKKHFDEFCVSKETDESLKIVSNLIANQILEAMEEDVGKHILQTYPAEQEVLEEIKKFEIKGLAGITDENERFLECNRRATFIKSWQEKLKEIKK